MRKRNDGERRSPQGMPDQRFPGQALFEVAARDEWQSSLITRDGESGGVVVRKIVEPASYMVRYLVVYRTHEDRHLLVPASTVTQIDIGELHCTLGGSDIARLPVYTFTEVTRPDEQAVYDAIAGIPYWLEESAELPGEDE